MSFYCSLLKIITIVFNTLFYINISTTIHFSMLFKPLTSYFILGYHFIMIQFFLCITLSSWLQTCLPSHIMQNCPAKLSEKLTCFTVLQLWFFVSPSLNCGGKNRRYFHYLLIVWTENTECKNRIYVCTSCLHFVSTQTLCVLDLQRRWFS